MSLLERFLAEVLDRGAESCLPRNLSDEWLRLLGESADLWIEPPDADDAEVSKRRSVAVAAVLSILRDKDVTTTELELPWEALFDHIREYRIELALEAVHRSTDIKCEPATLATIFTKRDVRTWREP